MSTKTIVIIEDDKDIQTLFEIILEKSEYTVMTFRYIRECEEYVSRITPDLFILDVCLPDGNGIAYCGELKSREGLKAIPVLVISANAKSSDALAVGADWFIPKPFDLEHLMSSTYRLLKTNEQANHSW